MEPRIYLAAVITVFVAAAALPAFAAQAGSPPTVSSSRDAGQTPASGMGHMHGASVPAISFAELVQTAERLAAARRATEKYQDVRTAEAAGYHAIGPNVAGMGTHYVHADTHRQFSITEPPILLYERDTAAPGGLRLVGVSYLLIAPSDPDGQPANPPFPKALASWHKHNNVCVLPDQSASVDLSGSQCTSRGGRFTAETSWMVHAWIWKDSPAGVFSPTNPLVK
jgi:hypothetical protein